MKGLSRYTHIQNQQQNKRMKPIQLEHIGKPKVNTKVMKTKDKSSVQRKRKPPQQKSSE